ncbi:MAG: hypothetical protein EB015_07370 [Methylocystaceae bacterium]|nr:hypothetical protein [Methylocystaceae bacterium]
MHTLKEVNDFFKREAELQGMKDEIERLREEVADLKELMQATVNYAGVSVSTEKYAFHASKALGEKE